MSTRGCGGEYEEFESTLPFRRDPDVDRWRRQLETLPSTQVSIREAAAVLQDGRRVWDLQVECPPIYVRSVRDNVSTIAERLVLLAEVGDVHVGFCVSLVSPGAVDPLFVQVIAVAPRAQRRGVCMALLTAVAQREPHCDIALATQDSNTAARALNERFAESLGASIGRVPLGRYRDSDLGIVRGQGYRAWVIQRRAR